MTQPSDSVYPKTRPPGSQKTSPWIQKNVPLDPKKRPPGYSDQSQPQGDVFLDPGGRFFGSRGTFFGIQGDVFWDPGGRVFGYTLSLGWVILFCFMKKILRFGMFYIYFCHQKTSLYNIYNYHFFRNCPFKGWQSQSIGKNNNNKRSNLD